MPEKVKKWGKYIIWLLVFDSRYFFCNIYAIYKAYPPYKSYTEYNRSFDKLDMVKWSETQI